MGRAQLGRASGTYIFPDKKTEVTNTYNFLPLQLLLLSSWNVATVPGNEAAMLWAGEQKPQAKDGRWRC